MHCIQCARVKPHARLRIEFTFLKSLDRSSKFYLLVNIAGFERSETVWFLYWNWYGKAPQPSGESWVLPNNSSYKCSQLYLHYLGWAFWYKCMKIFTIIFNSGQIHILNSWWSQSAFQIQCRVYGPCTCTFDSRQGPASFPFWYIPRPPDKQHGGK